MNTVRKYFQFFIWDILRHKCYKCHQPLVLFDEDGLLFWFCLECIHNEPGMMKWDEFKKKAGML